MSDNTKMKWPKRIFKRMSKLDKRIENVPNDLALVEEIDTYDQSQLDNLISEFCDEIFYDQENKERLLKMDIHQKRTLIKSRRQKLETSFVELETMLDSLNQLCISGGDTDDNIQMEGEKLFDQLSAALRTESLKYVKHFMDYDGLHFIFTYMRDRGIHALNSQTFSQCIRCIRSLGNSENGYSYLLAFNENKDETEPGLLEVIGKGLWSRNGLTVSMIAELFGALCFSQKGWLRVMDALKYLSRDDVNFRFAILVQQFIFQDNLDVKCSILSLINALAEFVQDHQDLLINRVHLRYQALKHGLGHYVKSLRNSSHVTLCKQIEVFVQHQQEDVEYLRTLDRLIIDHNILEDSTYNAQMDWTELINFMTEISKNLAFTDSQTHLSSLLHHLLLLPLQRENGYLYLQMIDLLVQQISIQQYNALNPDPGLSNLQLCVDEMLQKLATDNELKIKQQEVDNLTMECKSLNETVISLENKCFHIETEKNALAAQYQLRTTEIESEIKLREKLEVDNQTLLNEIAQLKLKCQQPCGHEKQSNILMTSDTIPSTSATPPPAPPPPPPPPPSFAIPPPPPPGPPPSKNIARPPGLPPPPVIQSGPTTLDLTQSNIPQKKIPKVDSLKCLNWSKIPQSKLSDSIWSQIDENKFYSKIDLELLQSEFSTIPIDYNSKPALLNNRSSPQVSRRPSSVTIPASLINLQRSQNLALKLKQARISWSKWQCQLLQCNVSSIGDENSFQYSLAEGLLKLYPTQEEIEILEDAVANHGIGNLPDAESFMYECYRFPLYQERLSCLIFFCKTPELIRRLFSELETIHSSIKSVKYSPTLPKLFELVLAIGNIMNQKRGIACGFKIDSLNQLKKVKCSTKNPSNITNLLHFVLITGEKTIPEILDLPKKLEGIQAACKINFNSICRDLNEISLSLKSLENTVNLLKKNPTKMENDKFLYIADELYPSICEDHDKLLKLQISVKDDIYKFHTFLGENPPTNPSNSENEDSTQKLLMELSTFLSDMDATWKSVLNDRERRHLREERKVNQKIYTSNNVGKKGDMDNNISRLLSGDVFSNNRLFKEMRDKQS